MSRVVRISDRTFKRIQKWAIPLEDTPDSVIERILDFYELNVGNPNGEQVTMAESSRDNPRGELPRDGHRETLPSCNAREAERRSEMLGLQSLSYLAKAKLPTKVKPEELIMNGQIIRVSHWTQLCVKFVEWLMDNGYLTKANCPVPNSAEQGKYFINTKPQHQIAEKDAVWKEVKDLYVDTKYWVNAHISNLEYALKYLKARDVEVEIRLK